MGYHEVSIGDGTGWRCTSGEHDQWYTKLMCLFPNFGYGGFPGLMPTSLERKHLPQIARDPFWFAEKTDGTRACLWCTEYKSRNVCVFFDRTFAFSLLAVTCDPILFHDTILDGELVWDRVRSKHVFLVFDCLMDKGWDCREQPMSMRIQRYQEACRMPWTCANFSMEAKPMVSNVGDIPPRTGWDVDGVILVPERIDLYTTGFKWKPMHTVDFVVFRTEGRWVPHVFMRSKHVPVDACVRWTEANDIAYRDGLVLECKYEANRCAWIPLRVRTDKNTPNSMSVYQKTVNAIEENIERDELARNGSKHERS